MKDVYYNDTPLQDARLGKPLSADAFAGEYGADDRGASCRCRTWAR